jgi:threonine aldolase
MRSAMMTAIVGDDAYGEDPTIQDLERLAAEKLGKQAACFMPSGTMANLASILAHCPRGAKAIVGDQSDIYLYEAGGASVCGGIVYHPVPNQPDGTMAITDIEGALPPDSRDPQFALAALICLENPQNHSGGYVLTVPYLAKIAAFARDNALAVHMDGSRIFNAAIAGGGKVDEIASFADSVQFCLSKGLGAPVGSIVVGQAPFIEKVRRFRKMLGGGMRQAGVLAAAGLVALSEMTARLADDHAQARRLADGLAELPGITLDQRIPEINMVFFRLSHPQVSNESFIAGAAARGVRLAELGHGRIRAVTHSGVGADDIDYALGVFHDLLR